MNSNFAEYCEQLWQQWIGNTLSVSPFIESEFQTDYLPEPYLCFDAARKPLHFLTTNPGQGMKHQNRQFIRSNPKLISPEGTYRQAASKLAQFYQEELTGPARTRVEGFLHLAAQSGRDGVLQFESCPFHSKALPKPKKKQLLDCYQKDDFLKTYASLLQETLRDVSVLSLSAVGTTKPISIQSIARDPWLRWQASLIDFVPEKAKLLPLTCKESKVTSALIYSQIRDYTKGFILMMGGNHLPAAGNLETVVELLKR